MIASMRSRYLKSESIRERAPIGSRTLQSLERCGRVERKPFGLGCSFGEIESLRKAGQCPSDPGWHRARPKVSWLSFNRHRLGSRPSLKAKCHNHRYHLCHLISFDQCVACEILPVL